MIHSSSHCRGSSSSSGSGASGCFKCDAGLQSSTNSRCSFEVSGYIWRALPLVTDHAGRLGRHGFHDPLGTSFRKRAATRFAWGGMHGTTPALESQRTIRVAAGVERQRIKGGVVEQAKKTSRGVTKSHHTLSPDVCRPARLASVPAAKAPAIYRSSFREKTVARRQLGHDLPARAVKLLWLRQTMNQSCSGSSVQGFNAGRAPPLAGSQELWGAESAVRSEGSTRGRPQRKNQKA